MKRIHIGCAGWALPKSLQEAFPPGGSHLARYAGRLGCAEINSSFYRPHQPATYARWAAAVPPGFRFSVKLPRRITHELRLGACDEELDTFLAQAGQLGDQLGCLLVQLPPSLALDEHVAERFWRALRDRHDGPVVVEPRHASWFGPSGDALLNRHHVGRVRADPLPCEGACWATGLREGTANGRPVYYPAYYRLHGSPTIYRSAYDEAYLAALAGRLRQEAAQGGEVWCIFDNTALGAATANALWMQDHLPQAAAAVEQGRAQNRK